MEPRYRHRLGRHRRTTSSTSPAPTSGVGFDKPEATGWLARSSVWRGRAKAAARCCIGRKRIEGSRAINALDASYMLIAGIDETLYIRTDHEAPNGRIIAVDVVERRAPGGGFRGS